MKLYTVRLPNGSELQVTYDEALNMYKDLERQVFYELDPDMIIPRLEEVDAPDIDWSFVYDTLNAPATDDPQHVKRRVGRLMGAMSNGRAPFAWWCSRCGWSIPPRSKWCSHRQDGVAHVAFGAHDIKEYAQQFMGSQRFGVGEQTLKDFRLLLDAIEPLLQPQGSRPLP